LIKPYPAIRLFAVLTLLFIYACDGGSSSSSESHQENPVTTIAAGIEGGTYTFTNGVTLEIPRGALSETTQITITDLPCSKVTSFFATPQITSHNRRCLRGISAEPDGIHFNAPITAFIPVSGLEPGDIPVQMEIDQESGSYQLVDSELYYDGIGGTVEVQIEHFSEKWLALLNNKISDICKDCDTFMDDICAYFPDPLQAPCCLLTNLQYAGQPSERQQCAPGCVCCRELGMEVRVMESDWAQSGTNPSNRCQILGSDLEIVFPYCPNRPTETSSFSETSAECPPGLEVKIDVKPLNHTIKACKVEHYEATQTILNKDGEIIYPPSKFTGFWKSLNKPVADFVDREGNIKGFSSGVAAIQAYFSASSPHPPGGTLLTVESNIGSFDITPLYNNISIGEDVSFVATITDSEGNLLDISNLVWSTDKAMVAELISNTGQTCMVRGGESGTATITATYQYDCETTEESVSVVVGCRNIGFSVDPKSIADMVVGEQRLLVATAIDLDDNGSEVSAGTVTWALNGPTIVALTDIDRLSSIDALSSGTTSVTATYDDDCQEIDATVPVTVGCFDLEITPSLAIVKMDAFLPVSVRAVDTLGNGADVDLSTVMWSSSDPNIASMVPTIGPSTMVVGIRPGTVNITATFQDACGINQTSADIEVQLDLTGTWHEVITTSDHDCNVADEKLPPPFYLDVAHQGNTVYADLPAGTAPGTLVDRTLTFPEQSSSGTTECIALMNDPNEWELYTPPQNYCQPNYCIETGRMNGTLSTDGRTINGAYDWRFETGWNCTNADGNYHVDISCEGTDTFVATKQ